MRKGLFLVGICLLLSLVFVELSFGAREGEGYFQIPFSSLGWKESVKLEGGNPAYTLYLPDFTGVDWGRSFLYLNLYASQLIRSPSSVSIYGDGELLLNAALRAGENSFRIPLAALSTDKDVHSIEVKAHLVISDDFCEDLASGNLFVIIRKDSLLNLYRKDTPLKSLEDFLHFPEDEVEILLPSGEWSPDLQRAFIELYAFLSRFYRGLPVRITAGMYKGETTESSDHRRIFLLEEGYRDFEIYDKSLYLTPQGVDALTRIPEFFVFTSSKVEKVDKQFSYSKQRVTLSGLGADGLTFRGLGEMKQTVYFTLSDLGGFPRSLKLVLYRNHLPSRYEATFSIKLNGEMVYSEKLDMGGVKELSPLTVQIPTALLGRENSLEFRFSYFPEVGHCRRSEAPFEGFISGKSYLEVEELASLPELLTFGDVPTFFAGKAQVVLPDKASFEDLMVASKIVASLRTIDRVPILVEVLKYSQVTDLLDPSLNLSVFRRPFFNLFYLPRRVREYSDHLRLRGTPTAKRMALSLAFACENFIYTLRDFVLLPCLPFLEKSVSPRNFLVFVDPPDTLLKSLSSPVVIDEGTIVLRSGLQSERLLETSPDQPLGVLSVFREGAFPAIIFIPYREKDIARSYFLENFEGVETLRWLSGNVAIIGKGGLSRLLTVEIPPSGWRIPSHWREVFRSFRLVIFLVGASLIVILAGFLYRRLTRPPL
ncbi:cellulose biosynthesis cyclic di-GMP-binding regulatory protein BcsB [Thermatribacter velox]|jgi:hypothetical protein|uniref:Cellulose biosynthesis cyclic di-GMP-binding regulatory protein BcsB n=1 Tax=Thermatribacter velox TaxID=3039681 RepID=A0ABZ2YDH7_9BACT